MMRHDDDPRRPDRQHGATIAAAAAALIAIAGLSAAQAATAPGAIMRHDTTIATTK